MFAYCAADLGEQLEIFKVEMTYLEVLRPGAILEEKRLTKKLFQ